MSGYQRISQGDGNHIQELAGEDVTFRGYQTNRFKLGMYWTINVILLGIPWLFMHWFSHWKVWLTCAPCGLDVADIVLITDDSQEKTICKIEVETVDFLPEEFGSQNGQKSLRHQNSRTRLIGDPETSGTVHRHFTFRHEKFVWAEPKDEFRKVEGLTDISCQQLLEEFRGLSQDRRMELRKFFGVNEIFVEVKSYFKLLVEEVLNPFYLFQIFSVLLWCFDQYYYYAVCVVVISLVSIAVSLYKTRQQSETLQQMAQGAGDMIVAILKPNGEEDEICCKDLVPGDVLLIPPEGCVMPCDAVVIQGNCIVNESMLTGESVPVNKSSMIPSQEMFNCDIHKKHVIFCGTHVIQPRFYAGNKVACVVVRTGYSTLKGQLIRSILYPKEVGFKFYADSMKFVFILFCFALTGMVYCIYLYVQRGSTWYVLIVRVLDIVTIVVPPALPAAMTVGTLNAQSRLKRKEIFCISPQRINYCGKLKLVCFDKTGTLTEEGLNLSCVVPVEVNDDNVEEFSEPVSDPQLLPVTSHLLRGMATCHSLTYIKGNIVGDPLDLKMFSSTGWNLEEPMMDGNDTERFDLLTPSVVKRGDTQIGIIREFDFTPQLQRMSVVVNSLDTHEMVAYCKGAPEKIFPLCVSVPENYDKVLDWFTVKGYRVLALGWKKVEGMTWHQVQRASREKIEVNLHFAGFLVMQNSLKLATMPVIKELTTATVKCVMVTGDNMLTALSVARECGMVPSQDKVVIVNVTENDTLEYTLAAQHYEVPDEDAEQTGETSNASNNNGEGGVRYSASLGDETDILTPSRRLSHRFSFESNASDTIIDVQKLIPFTDIRSEILEDCNYHFVLTGKTWTFLQQNCSKAEFQRIITKGSVYARMSPECKKQLVEALQEIGYTVAMCGDGANDCSALSVAHVGISLSEAEASVAAPFTSKIADVSCVPKLILEGRCALVTSFGIFKYMALYSMVQFASVLILYTHLTNLADTQFLWIDLAITMTITVVMGRTEPVKKLVSKRPMGSLVSFPNMFSIFSQILICVVTQWSAITLLSKQVWFTPLQPKSGDELETLCWETTTIFSVSSFQYLIMSVVFSKGPPFRKPFYSNFEFLLANILLTSFTAVLMIYPVDGLATFFSLEPITPSTQSFRFLLVAFPVVNTLLSFVIENFIAGSKLVKRVGKMCCKGGTKNPYKDILAEIETDQSWPPIIPK